MDGLPKDLFGDDDFVNVYTAERPDDQLHRIGSPYEALNSGKTRNDLVAITTALRKHYPELLVTVSSASNIPLLAFAEAGFADATIDTESESVHRIRGAYRTPPPSSELFLGDSTIFAKYRYRWNNEDYILYTAYIPPFYEFQFVLKEPGEKDVVRGNCRKTDELLQTAGDWGFPKPDGKYIYVYDGYWNQSREMYNEIEKSTWKDVILDEKMKKDVTKIASDFFDSKEIYHDLGVPWKRGIMFHGPAGNGKTISIKALMHSLFFDRNPTIPVVYVKSAPNTWHIRNVFTRTRDLAPCLLILEDIDTIVTKDTRSYFFNEVDGMESNDGIMMLATTNHLDELDPGLSQRPSRFDRKYLFPLPNESERTLYAQFWQKKLKDKKIDFPDKLCPAIAGITKDFSFAYLKEAFVATLLAIAKQETDNLDFETTAVQGFASLILTNSKEEDDDFDKYELWRVMKKQVAILRKEMAGTSRVIS